MITIEFIKCASKLHAVSGSPCASASRRQYIPWMVLAKFGNPESVTSLGGGHNLNI